MTPCRKPSIISQFYPSHSRVKLIDDKNIIFLEGNTAILWSYINGKFTVERISELCGIHISEVLYLVKILKYKNLLEIN